MSRKVGEEIFPHLDLVVNFFLKKNNARLKGEGNHVSKKNKNHRRPPRMPQFEDFADADQAFLAAMDELDYVPVKDHKKSEVNRSAASPRVVERVIDLHGLTLVQALAMVDAAISAVRAENRAIVELTIITGKGRHSGADGGVLVREVHSHVVDRYQSLIESIDESPAKLLIAGLPWRGHFKVRFRRS